MHGFLTEVVSIVIRQPLSPFYPVVKDEFQFRHLKVTQKFLNASEKILWPGEVLCGFYVSEKADGVLE
jgi:hypothetical protein